MGGATQYQKLDDYQGYVNGTGDVVTRRAQQEFWVRTLDLHHQSYPSSTVLLESNLRYADQAFLGMGNNSRTPFGSLRLISPRLQIIASLQPAQQTSSLSAQSGLNRDSLTSRHVTSRSREALVTGHFALPKWPQVDASWVARRRDGAGSVGDRNTSRNLRMTLDRERWSTYAGVNDQAITSSIPGSGRNTQQVWTAGGAYHLSPRRDASVHAQYDVSAVRGVSSGARRPTSVNHSASLGSDWRPNAKWLGSASYQLRHVDFGTSNNPPQTDHEGALIARYSITRRSSVLGGAGIRTVRNFLPEGGTSVALQKYLTSVASMDARVRRNWTMTGGLTHTTNFDPDHAAYHIETMSATSRAQLVRRVVVDGSIQLTANSDSGAVASRYSNSWSARVTATPLRTIQFAVSGRSLRTGPGLLRPVAVSRGIVIDGTWKPTTNLNLVGQYGTSNAQPNTSGTNSTRSLTARYQPSRKWQCYGSWTRSDQRAVVSVAGQLSSRETVNSRLQFEPNRQLAMAAGVTYNDPGKPQESKRLDLAFTWSFGR